MKKLLEWWRARRRIAGTKVILYGLSDHALRDIGIRRDQIDYLRFETPKEPEARRPRVRAITVLRAS